MPKQMKNPVFWGICVGLILLWIFVVGCGEYLECFNLFQEYQPQQMGRDTRQDAPQDEMEQEVEIPLVPYPFVDDTFTFC